MGIPCRNGYHISTSNPAKEKVVVRSLSAATTICGATLPAYTMSPDDTGKYVYDSEVWLIRPSSATNENLWLTYNLDVLPGGGLNHVVFDFNLPGATPVIYSGVQAGSSIPIPILGDSAIGAQPVKFLGWYDKPVGGTKIQGASVAAQAGLTVYYAHWEIISVNSPDPLPEGSLYPVFFDQNYDGGGLTSLVVGSFKFTVYKSSGSVSEGDGTISYTPEEYTFALPFAFPGDPARTGYTFAGWGLTSNSLTGVGTGYFPPNTVTLYAIWRAKTYSISWDVNGGFGGGVTTQSHDDKLILPSTPPTRAGYSFTGWYADKYGGTPVSADTIVTGPATYYAGWTPAEYNVTWDANYTGGSVALTQQKHDEPLVVAQNPVRAGYAFAGWWTQPGGQGTNAQSYGLVRGHQIFYAYWVTDTLNYTVTLEWDDFGDNDAVRPESVKVALLRNGLATGLTYSFDAVAHPGDIWTYTFSNLPVADAVSNPYVYSVAVMSSIPDDYTYASDFSSSAYAGYIRLTHTLITWDIPIYVVWDDDSNRDGYRPATVDVRLCAGGVPLADAETRITLPGDGNTWTYTFPNCRKYFGRGNEVVYTIEVSASGAGELAQYDVSYSQLTGLTATLIHAVDTVSKTVHVEWQDNSDQDGKRPASMTVQLYADNQPVQGRFVTLSAANGWRYTWAGLPKLRDGGTPIVYSAYVSSTLVDYIAASTEMTIEMTYTPSVTSISAFVSWTDESNADGLRPDYVIAELIADGVPTGDTQQLSAVNNWRTVWTGYPIYREGSRIEYTFRVEVPNGYSAEYMGACDTSGLSAVLRHERIRDDFTARIVWNDGGNLSGARMALVRVMLYADGSPIDGSTIPNVDVTADSYTISGYVMDEAGNPIEGAQVYLYRQDGETAGQLVAQTASDKNGYYEFKNLPVGNYIVKVIPRYGAEENFDVLAKPDSPNDGEDGGPKVTTDSYTVSGTVLDDDGNPVKGATVILTDLDGNIVGKQITGEDGKYKFSELGEGAYILIISYPDKENLGGGEVDVPGGGNPGGGNPGGGTGGSGGSGGGTGGSGGSGGGGGSAALHKPYIYGYVDGTVRPTNAITRAEAAAILSRVSAGFDPQGTYTASFPDVPAGAWYVCNLGYCVRTGIFTGFPDGTFGPEAPITRAEFAAIVARLLGLDNTGTSKFVDVTGTWAEGYIARLTARGIITGLPDGTFNPTAPISRAEAVTILNRALDRNPIPATLDKVTEGGARFSDMDKSYWAYYQVLEAALEHIHN